MSLIILFGLPGTGKTYVGKILKEYFGFYFYDGDNDLTEEMIDAIKTKTVFTDQMRDRFFIILIKKIQSLKSKYQKLVVSQTFIKEKYRLQLLKKIPEAKFFLIKTKRFLREKRLIERKDYPLDLEYARKMVKNFETPKIDHKVIKNNKEGAKYIKKQIQQFLLQFPF